MLPLPESLINDGLSFSLNSQTQAIHAIQGLLPLTTEQLQESPGNATFQAP